MANRISLNGTSYHGAGAIGEVVNEFNSRGFKKAFVATDALNDACYPGNPREATKEQVIEMFRQLMA